MLFLNLFNILITTFSNFINIAFALYLPIPILLINLPVSIVLILYPFELSIHAIVSVCNLSFSL